MIALLIAAAVIGGVLAGATAKLFFELAAEYNNSPAPAPVRAVEDD